MTTFEDGPAKGQRLMLKHAPEFLRVVVDEKEKWDALDLPTDTPRPEELIYAYRLSEKTGMCHINAGRGRSGFYTIARYGFVKSQPTSAMMRDTVAWQAWCESKI